MEDTAYYRQARLLLRILPVIARYPIFALKGGTEAGKVPEFLKDKRLLFHLRQLSPVNIHLITKTSRSAVLLLKT